MPITKPAAAEYPPYFDRYISKVGDHNLADALRDSGHSFVAFLKTIPKDKYDYRYAEGKWTIKEIVGHIIDCERVFMYRALSFSRNDQSPLPGFDEDAWAQNSNAGSRSMDSLIEEYEAARKANVAFFRDMTEEMALRKGKSNGNEISVRSLGFVIPGHEIHHTQVIKERYL